jgi:polygalacturonase
MANAGLCWAAPSPIKSWAGGLDDQDPWQVAQKIADRLSAITPISGPDFLIVDHGAKPCELISVRAWVSHDKQATISSPHPQATDCYAAIATAIQTCHAAGGGRVVVPAGNWYCAGPIVLLSNVHVHLQAGAQIFFSPNPADYARHGDIDCGPNGRLVRSRWQSNDCLNFSPMIYAIGQSNIALTGEDWSSILNGQAGVPFSENGQCWWSYKGNLGNVKRQQATENGLNAQNPDNMKMAAPHLTDEQVQLIQGKDDRWRSDFGYLPALSEAGVPSDRRIFGLGHYLRPPMVQLIDCNAILLQGYQTTNTPFWQHHPVHCSDLAIRHVWVNSMGPNNDGIDPDACVDVLIDACTFNTGDDCIAIKSGKDLDVGYGAAKNIVIQNCTMVSGHGALTLGSEMSGGIENIYAQNLVFENKNWKTSGLNTGIRLKTNMNRGGYLRNLYVRNVSLPNGVSTNAKFYKPLDPAAGLDHVATGAGAIITIDCDYAPQEDNVRNRVPQVSNIFLTGINAGNVATSSGSYSCYQALAIQGPVRRSYNGSVLHPVIKPVRDINISNCSFGTPSNDAQPFYVYNASNIRFTDVRIGAEKLNAVVNAPI